MKRSIIIFLLVLALPLLAADRKEVTITIPVTGPDSLLADSIEKQARAINPLIGQIIITNSKVRIVGFVTDKPKALKDTVKIKALKKKYPHIKTRTKVIKPAGAYPKGPY